MYIDDGAIFMCGNNWEEIKNTMHTGYTACMEWLTRAGLSVFFFFLNLNLYSMAHTTWYRGGHIYVLHVILRHVG
jgi:hypothetical protein